MGDYTRIDSEESFKKKLVRPRIHGAKVEKYIRIKVAK